MSSAMITDVTPTKSGNILDNSMAQGLRVESWELRRCRHGNRSIHPSIHPQTLIFLRWSRSHWSQRQSLVLPDTGILKFGWVFANQTKPSQAKPSQCQCQSMFNLIPQKGLCRHWQSHCRVRWEFSSSHQVYQPTRRRTSTSTNTSTNSKNISQLNQSLKLIPASINTLFTK